MWVRLLFKFRSFRRRQIGNGIKMNRSNIGLPLLVLILISYFQLSAQSILDLGRSELPSNYIQYDSGTDRFGTYVSSFSGFRAQYDSSSLFYYLQFNGTNGQWDSLQVRGLNRNEGHYFNMDQVENDPGFGIWSWVNPKEPGSGPGGWISFKSGIDICGLNKDSVFGCASISPVNAYTTNIIGVANKAGDDSLSVFAFWTTGSTDTTFEYYRIAVNKNDRNYKVHEVNLSKSGVNYYPISQPLELPDGTWLVESHYFNDNSGIGGQLLLKVNSDWSQVISSTPLLFAYGYYSKMWLKGDRVILFTTGNDPDSTHWISGLNYFARIALIEYDYIQDSILNVHQYSSNGLQNPMHHEAGFSAYYDGEYFSITALRFFDFWSDYRPSGGVLWLIDTNFNVANTMVLEDTSGEPLLGIIRNISRHPITGDFHYSGQIGGDVTGGLGLWDLFFGSLAVSGVSTGPELIHKVKQHYVYPNPGDGHFVLSTRTDNFTPFEFTIYNASGEAVHSETATSEKHEVYSNLPVGTYYLDAAGEINVLVIK